jgi:FMN phosphatase YigB (HAD superfamily)
MGKVKSVFFDLYNTLIYLPKNEFSFRTIFKACGVRKGEIADAMKIILTEEFETIKQALVRLGLDPFDGIENMEAGMRGEIANASLFDDTLEVLEGLKRNNLALCLVSNASTHYKAPIFMLGLEQIFDKIIFSCEIGYRKPEKEIFKQACLEMRIEPVDALMVGDSPASDYQGAVNSGLEGMLIDRSGAKHEIPAIRSLIELIEII